ncbi:MAG: MBL fold metallo-hydrolase [Ruminococcus sp.]|nr:MBL fold metallo-hydrolase [Ruminococcus sp.]
MRRWLGVLFVMLAAAVLALASCSINKAESRPDDGGTVTGDGTAPPPPGEREDVTVYCFKAGKADAHLIYSRAFAVLIDCGESGFGKEIVSYMKAHGIPRLDMLVITHFDKDHVGGAAKVLKEIEVAQVVHSNSPKDSDEYRKYIAQLEQSGIEAVVPAEPQSVVLGGVEFTIFPPLRTTYPDSPSNNSSLITSVKYGECSMLFAGDAEDARLSEFMSVNTEHYDLLKVPYHGHYQSRLGAFIQSTSPRIAVITSSDAEPEDPQVLRMLSDEGAATYLTRTAPVIIHCDGHHLRAEYEGS